MWTAAYNRPSKAAVQGHSGNILVNTIFYKLVQHKNQLKLARVTEWKVKVTYIFKDAGSLLPFIIIYQKMIS